MTAHKRLLAESCGYPLLLTGKGALWEPLAVSSRRPGCGKGADPEGGRRPFPGVSMATKSDSRLATRIDPRIASLNSRPSTVRCLLGIPTKLETPGRVVPLVPLPG
jgi:hypothetical protein